MVLNRRSLERSFSPMSKVKRKSIYGRKSVQCSPGSARKAKENTKRQSNVKVVVRVRPSNDKELGDNYRSVVQLVDDKMLVFDPKIDEPSFFYHGVKQSCRDLLKKQNKDTTYIFDKVFGFTSTNEEVFEGSTKEMIKTLLTGYNCSVFVYGATGAGKTYTMLGSADSPGITYLTMVELYSEMEKLKDEKTFDLCVSYLEVYNENVRDLLQPSGPLHVREDARTGVSVAGLKMEKIDSADKLLAMLAQGNKNRTQHPTDANSESSRSHAVFQVHIRMTHRLSSQISLVKLSMVDLAGSERGSATGCTGARFTEGANINKSLLALGNCINNLADGLKHIPYRDSKLTRLLKDSLGGNCYTVMIANVSPSSKSYEDTQNTLKYATRAMKIKSTVKSNVVNCEMHVSQYARLVEELNRKLAAQNEEINKLKEQLNSNVINVVNEERSPEKVECDEIHHWRKKLREMYKIKKKLNSEILLVEMKRKILHWRAYTKQKVAARVAVLCYDNEQLQQAVDRIEMSQRQYRAREESFASVLKTIKEQKSKHSEEMDSAMKLIEEAGFTDSLKEEILVNDLKVEKENAEVKSQYLKKLINLQQNEMEGHYIMFQTICHMTKEYYLMLKGFGKETNAMKESYQEAVRMMVGIKNVTWEDDQNDHMKYLKELLRLSASLNDRIAADQTPVANEGILLQNLSGKDSSCLASKGSEQLSGLVDLSLSCNEKSSDWSMKSYVTSPMNNEMFPFENVSPECSLYYTDKMGIEVRKKNSKDRRRTVFSDDTEETETHSQEADAAILKCEAEMISELLKNESSYYSPKIVSEPDLDNMFSCVSSTTNRTNNSALCEITHTSPQTKPSEINWLRQGDFKNDSEEVHCEQENFESRILQAASKPDLNETFSCEVEIKTRCSGSVIGEAACTLPSDSEGQQLKSHILPPVSEPDLNNTFSCETQSQSKKEEKEFCFLRPADVKCGVKKLQASSHNSTLDSTFSFARDADPSRNPIVEKLPLESPFVIKRPAEKCKDITNKTFIQHKKLVSPAVPGKRNILSNRNTTNIMQKDIVNHSDVKHLGNTGKMKNLVRAQAAQNSTLNKENIYSPNITKRKIQRSESMKLPVKKNQESLLPSKRVSPSNVCSGIASYQQVLKPAANRHRNISSTANLIYGSKTLPETRVKNTCLLRSS